jgi:hypothetical protein
MEDFRPHARQGDAYFGAEPTVMGLGLPAGGELGFQRGESRHPEILSQMWGKLTKVFSADAGPRFRVLATSVGRQDGPFYQAAS